MLLRHAISLLLIAVSTTGCDRINGVAEQKISDAEATGYACRVSSKKPEDCMKEYEAQSPTSILSGWKAADKDIQENTLDPSMGSDHSHAAHHDSASAVPATENHKPEARGEATSPEKDAEKPATPDKKTTKSH